MRVKIDVTERVKNFNFLRGSNKALDPVPNFLFRVLFILQIFFEPDK
jgi:hypothetical protein